jgi:hypothetical protein
MSPKVVFWVVLFSKGQRKTAPLWQAPVVKPLKMPDYSSSLT